MCVWARIWRSTRRSCPPRWTPARTFWVPPRRISGYEKTSAVEPFYAEEGDPLFEKLQAIIDGQLVLDALKTDVVEVKLWQEGEGGYPAVKESAYIEVTAYGGDTTGYQIPFKIHFTGEKVNGHFDVATKTFTAA